MQQWNDDFSSKFTFLVQFCETEFLRFHSTFSNCDGHPGVYANYDAFSGADILGKQNFCALRAEQGATSWWPASQCRKISDLVGESILSIAYFRWWTIFISNRKIQFLSMQKILSFQHCIESNYLGLSLEAQIFILQEAQIQQLIKIFMFRRRRTS